MTAMDEQTFVVVAVKSPFELALRSALIFGTIDSLPACYPEEWTAYRARVVEEHAAREAERVRVASPVMDCKGRYRDKSGRFFRVPAFLREANE